MSTTLEQPPTSPDPAPTPTDEENHQADFLPTFDGGPVAAGMTAADTLNLQLTKPLRPMVPTERQRAAGEVLAPADAVAPVSEAALEAAPQEAKPPLRRRLRRAAAFYNPLSIPGPRLPVLVLGALFLLGQSDDVILRLIAPEVRADFGVSIAFMIQLSVVMGAAAQLLALPMGYLVDRVKRVWLVRISAIGQNAASLVMATAGAVGVFVAGKVMSGSSQAVGNPATFPLLADYYPSRARGRAYAFLFLMSSLSALITLPAAGILVVRFGWRPVVFVFAAVALAVSLLTFLLKEPMRGGMDRLEMGASAAVAAEEQPPLGWQEALRAAWSIRTLRLQAFSTVVMLFTAPVTVVVSLVYAERFGLDASQRSLILTLIAVGSMLALALAGPISEKLLTKRPATVAVVQAVMSFTKACLLVVQAFAPVLILFVPLDVLFNVIAITVVPIWMTVFSVVVPARVRGLGMQIFAPFALVGTLIAIRFAELADTMTPQQALLLFSPLYVVAGMLQLATASGIGGDIRRARAAAMADEAARKAREAGANRMVICRDVDVAYDGVQILFNVDLDVAEGETVALLGTNGAGKSTLLRAISGLTQAENGAILLDGRDVTAMPSHQLAELGVVFMPGGRAVFPAMTVRDNLTTAAWMYRDDERYVHDGIERVLEYFPILRERLSVPAGHLSGGEQQMVALGQAFLMKPRLLMIDELSLGLAPAVVDQLLATLREIREQGTTIVLVEQSLNVAAAVADRAVFMDKGRIEFDGPVEELVRRPDLVRAIFMGGAAAGASVGRRTRQVTEEETMLTGRDLSLSYGGVQALDDVSLSVRGGEIVGIIGPNGAGKTTLFDVLSGYSVPDSGQVLLGEEDVTQLPPYARAKLGLGRSFQNARLFPALTVRDTIAVALEKRAPKNPFAAATWSPGTRKKERKLQERVDGYIDLIGLGAHADKFVAELSTGSRRAVEVACVMAAEPRVLLLDEPSSGLAQAEIEALGPTLSRITRETGCALIVIEHDLPLITQISDRLVAMELGRVLADGTPAEVTSDPLVMQSYLAASDDTIHRSGSRMSAVLTALIPESTDQRRSTP